MVESGPESSSPSASAARAPMASSVSDRIGDRQSPRAGPVPFARGGKKVELVAVEITQRPARDLAACIDKRPSVSTCRAVSRPSGPSGTRFQEPARAEQARVRYRRGRMRASVGMLVVRSGHVERRADRGVVCAGSALLLLEVNDGAGDHRVARCSRTPG